MIIGGELPLVAGVSRMDRTIRQHVEELKQRLAILNSRIMEEQDVRKRNNLHSELRAVESVLALYKSALEVESRIGKVGDIGSAPPPDGMGGGSMRPARALHALVRTYNDVERNHTMQMAAALSYYFVLSLFPALIFLSAVVAYLPVPDLFNEALALMARFLPGDSMGLVRRVLADVVSPNKGTFLSFGILGTLWAASGGFAAAIEALNIAYDVKDDRPFWKTRPLALGLAFMTGALLLVALSVMIVGPRFGEWLAGRVHLSNLFILLWPYLHWTLAVGFTILAVEAIYFVAPNVRQRFIATLPGATLAVGCWIGLSYLLGIYFRHFANFNKTYGTLGAAIALMVWLYWTGFAMLVGAELNAELAKISSAGRVEEKHEPPAITRIDLAA